VALKRCCCAGGAILSPPLLPEICVITLFFSELRGPHRAKHALMRVVRLVQGLYHALERTVHALHRRAGNG